ncbi:Zeta-sarcoglycan [Bagarius yarrelli]|uniref:Zeta-sarcoglycan n=1 Tax=Bagarius yarrelli TaxID=175774 RepID=A0A556U8D0_BAGYA|nr:Zeta-sarcoglycan [Bagarius yarrelli]
MGNRVHQAGVRLEGISEFLLPLYVKEIQSRWDSPLILQSDRNVTVNARNNLGQLTGQLTVGAPTLIKKKATLALAKSPTTTQTLVSSAHQGSETVEAQCQRFEVRSSDGDRVLFSADENEVSISTEKLRVTGNEGVVFAHSVETPHIRAEPFQDLKLESPTRTLTLEAPKGVEVNAGVGEFKASCRKELTLASSEGEIFLNAKSIRMPNLPHGSVDPLLSPGTSYPKHTVYEVCVCPSGKLYLSPADSASTCQTTNSWRLMGKLDKRPDQANEIEHTHTHGLCTIKWVCVFLKKRYTGAFAVVGKAHVDPQPSSVHGRTHRQREES